MRLLRNYLRSAISAAFGLAAVATVAYGLTNPPTYTPRMFPDQQVTSIRFSLNVASCVQVSNTCTIQVPASLPYNSVILRVTAVTHTAFNSTTSDVVTLGTTSANANEIVSSGCSIHTQAITACTVLATASSAVGNSATQTGRNGGFDLYVKWTGGGGTPTTGNAAVIIEYISPNDGACQPVPMGSTAVGC